MKATYTINKPLVCAGLICSALIALPALATPTTQDSEQVKFTLKQQSYVPVRSAKVSIIANITANDTKASFQSILEPVFKREKNTRIEEISQSKTDSGLTQYKVLLTQRVAIKDINALKARYKDYDKAGVQFRIADINYSPTPKQYENKWSSMRINLYKQAQKELKAYSKVAGQPFKIKSIQYWHSNATPAPVLLKSYVATSREMSNGASNANMADAASQAVASKVSMTANVTLEAKS